MAKTIRRLSRLHLPGHGNCLGVVTDDDVRVDLSGSVVDLGSLAARHPGPETFEAAIAAIYDGAKTAVAVGALAAGPQPGQPHLLAPVDRQECWGAGCTYRVDDTLPQMRKQRPLYAHVYEAARPMLFFKAAAQRVAGPGGRIARRRAAGRTIPEAELAVLLSPAGRPLAYALGNDVTALDLEQTNPLYQPQAKIFDGSAALGPWWTPAASAPDALVTPFTCTVLRDGHPVLRQQIDPRRLVRSLEELAGRLFEATSFPPGAVLMTGGGAAVPPEFALADGDTVIIAHPHLGQLHNHVESSRRQNPTTDKGVDNHYAVQV